MPASKITDDRCSIARTVAVVGERWSLLIVRDAFRGSRTFSEFRARLGVPSDVLSARLASLVEAGVFTKVAYQDPGERERFRYELTTSGRGLLPLLAAMIEWGDQYRPLEDGPTSVLTAEESGAALRIAFVDADGREVPEDAARLSPGPGARTSW
ncbi:helix-turn-helix transcriptional regulator [Microbacteriaceae bacterium VKM Ac-2855]|nr:helix-turn-helix transcriptional regulator [Microbacteriaceae bacterium VKM Ac-2855]